MKRASNFWGDWEWGIFPPKLEKKIVPDAFVDGVGNELWLH